VGEPDDAGADDDEVRLPSTHAAMVSQSAA
jgi:hypothetical protein